MRQYFCAKNLQSQNDTREKLRKALLYEKFVRKMLMKLTHTHIRTSSEEALQFTEIGTMPKTMEHLLSEQQQQQQQQQQQHQ